MSNLKKTHLSAFGGDAYSLFEKYVKTEEVHFLSELFRSKGFEMRMAGGGVRDILCRIVPHDIDFATDARPDQMVELMSDKPNIRLITTTSGQKHGTVTARVNDCAQYEITTLRIDKTTDGRHAEVEFVNDWKVDASRRDLTINSMFIDLEGTLYDYFDGKADLDRREIRFVGDTASRLREDYLRIFRYFRFHTRFGVAGRHDAATIQTMKEHVDGLEIISGERIWMEMRRILGNINCGNAVQMMLHELGMGRHMGFGSEVSLEEFYRTQQRLAQYPHDGEKHEWKPQTLLASLVPDSETLLSVVTRMRLSNQERDSMAYILQNRTASADLLSNIHLLRTQLALTPRPNQAHLREFILQYLMYMGAEEQQLAAIASWPVPVFPFNGRMVANRVRRKQQISKLLDRLKAAWAASNFEMDEEAMQAEVDRILERLLEEEAEEEEEVKRKRKEEAEEV